MLAREETRTVFTPLLPLSGPLLSDSGLPGPGLPKVSEGAVLLVLRKVAILVFWPDSAPSQLYPGR